MVEPRQARSSCFAQRRVHPAEAIGITLRSNRPTAFFFQ
jgi:hypothetical protein